MIKLTFCLVRLTPLSRAQFQDYWFNRHAPLVASVAEVLGIRRYVQMHSLPEETEAAMRASRGAPPGYDGVAELWFDSLEAVTARSDPAATEAGRMLLEDEKRFIDHSRSPLWWGQERAIVG